MNSCSGYPHINCVIEECQSCGEEVSHRSKYDISRAELDDRAWNPYNYVRYCRDCLAHGYQIEPDYRLS